MFAPSFAIFLPWLDEVFTVLRVPTLCTCLLVLPNSALHVLGIIGTLVQHTFWKYNLYIICSVQKVIQYGSTVVQIGKFLKLILLFLSKLSSNNLKTILSCRFFFFPKMYIILLFYQSTNFVDHFVWILINWCSKRAPKLETLQSSNKLNFMSENFYFGIFINSLCSSETFSMTHYL